MQQALLTTRQAAERLGVSEYFLERDRCTTARIPFIRVGTRAVRYRPEDLDRFVASSERRSTADKGTATSEESPAPLAPRASPSYLVRHRTESV
jgi:excisionase family DNA binding protein